jgi:hypothetical protein
MNGQVKIGSGSGFVLASALGKMAKTGAQDLQDADAVETQTESRRYQATIVGLQYHEGWAKCTAGAVSLCRHPDNVFDEWALRIDIDNIVAGYLPRAAAYVLSQLLDEGRVSISDACLEPAALAAALAQSAAPATTHFDLLITTRCAPAEAARV